MKGKVVSIHPRTSKGELMKMVFGSEYRNIDSATPKDLWGLLDDTYWYVMDYRTNGLGQLTDMRQEVTILCNGEVEAPHKIEW